MITGEAEMHLKLLLEADAKALAKTIQQMYIKGEIPPHRKAQFAKLMRLLKTIMRLQESMRTG